MPILDQVSVQQLETVLVKLLRSRGYVINTPSWSGDRYARVDGTFPKDVRLLNLTELAKDIIRDTKS
jgi:hypothetical protein